MGVGGVRPRYEAQVRGRVPEWPAVGGTEAPALAGALAAAGFVPGPERSLGDYYLYLDPGLCFGTLGHPWEHTLCAFGAPLLAEAEAELTALLGEPVRRRD
ncbi:MULTISPECIES: DUF2716 domain-containing protein [unclassified Streptomyces]|uniref:DUF2716 domain-containing protein n=1 Tax=unclassified Streptomyces TaxID=2593676 RepID=UPI0035DA20D2